jgi:hypothetical protein
MVAARLLPMGEKSQGLVYPGSRKHRQTARKGLDSTPWRRFAASEKCGGKFG